MMGATAKLRRVKAIPIARFRDEVVAEHAPPKGNPGTFQQIKLVLNVLERTPGVETTADLTPEALDRAVVTGGWTNPATIKSNRYRMQRLCAFAVQRGYLASEPFTRTRQPKRDFAAPILDTADVAILLKRFRTIAAEAWAGHRLYVLVCLAVFARVRLTDALRLRVTDYDRARRRLMLTRGPVELDPGTAAVVEEWVGRCGPEFMFPRADQTDGAYSSGYANVDMELDRECRAAGVDGVTFPALARYGMAHAAELAAGPQTIGRSVEPVPIPRLREEVISSYAGTAMTTRNKVERTFDVLERTPGVETTADLTPEAVERFVATGGWDKETTIYSMKNTLKVICVFAVRSGWLARSPFPRDRRPWKTIAQARPGTRSDLAEPVQTAPSVEKPAASPPMSWDELVKLGGPDDPPVVLGKRKPRLRPKPYALIEALVKAGPDGLYLHELRKVCRSFRDILKELGSDDDYKAVIKFPGEPWGGRYRIGFPGES